jgi:hypothetical protein
VYKGQRTPASESSSSKVTIVIKTAAMQSLPMEALSGDILIAPYTTGESGKNLLILG